MKFKLDLGRRHFQFKGIEDVKKIEGLGFSSKLDINCYYWGNGKIEDYITFGIQEVENNSFLKNIFKYENRRRIDFGNIQNETLFKMLKKFSFKKINNANFIFEAKPLKKFFLNYKGKFEEGITFSEMLENYFNGSTNSEGNLVEDVKEKIVVANDLQKIIIVHNIKELLLKRKEYATKWIEEADNNDYFYPKNCFWISRSYSKDVDKESFKYIERDFDDYYLDLVTVSYLNREFAIPVPVIANIAKVDESDIYECFNKRLSKDEVNFI